jgi:ABC-type Fe3+-hydroxamate transport system substrate-binding protein
MILQKTSDLNYIPKRIISLVPSQTELLHYLGLEAETVGITKFCVHPEHWFKTKPRVGGTKAVKNNIIHELKPDLIIANKEENIKEQVELLAKDYPVWVTDVNDLEGALAMIHDIGEMTAKQKQADVLIKKINEGFDGLASNIKRGTPKLKTAYLIWRNPYMSIGGDTFINDILLKCGFENVFVNRKRYPEIDIEDLQLVNCQLILLSSEPYPFKQKHIEELSGQLPNCKIVLADGEMFSWYGSRLLQAPEYFKTLISRLF